MKRLIFSISVLVSATTGLCAADGQPYLAENLTVWLRADMGLTTNAVGGVTAWANQGTLGTSVDVAPHADNSDGHVAYEASGIGNQPSLLFDGSVYLKTAGNTNLGITSAGGAWFVVYKTPCTRTERANMAIMGGVPSNGYRFGAFFLNNGTEHYNNFFFGEVGPIAATSNATQIASAMCWKENGATRAYPMNGWAIGTVSSPGIAPAPLVFMVGNFIPSWMQTFKGEIAEIRIYNRPLTDRERSRIQFELCVRYGVHWSAHGDINNDALRWYERSAQFGHALTNGVPEEMISSASSGGATFALGTPSAAENTRGYFTNNGGNGLARIWYVSAHTATRNASAATFTFDRTRVHVCSKPSLYYKSSPGGAWTKTDATVSEANDSISFTLPAGSWANGFYAVLNDLDRSLSMWHRADMGLTTNAAGCVTAWTNYGTTGNALDMALPADIDSSAAHIAYTADGMGGRPSLSFDGEAYLRSTGASNLGISPAGSTWFVVCKTDQDKNARGNMAIFGCAPGGIRFGGFFSNAGDATQGNLRCYIFSGSVCDAQVEKDKTQIFTMVHWAANDTNYRYAMGNSTIGARGGQEAATPTYGNVYVGGQMLSWTKNLIGDIAEIRVYNRPLTARERMAIQFELFAYYGVSYSVIDDEGLAWYERGAQLGYCEGYGLPEEIAVSAMSGGATVTFDETPDPTAWTYSYLANNGSNGFDRVWYFFGSTAARALPMTFSVDPGVVGRDMLGLYYSPSSGEPWSRIGMCDGADDGQCSFPFAANSWQSGFYRVDKLKGTAIILR